MDKKGAYKTYRLFWLKVLAVANFSACGYFFDKDFTATRITFRARNENEAMRKAKKFWLDGQFGMGSITVKEEHA